VKLTASIEQGSLEVDHTLRVIGDSNDELSSGFEIELPFEDVEIESVHINSVSPKYEIVDNQIFINLTTQEFLKSGQETSFRIKYKIQNVLGERFNYKYLLFPSPTNNQKKYSYEIESPDSDYSFVYSNGSGIKNIGVSQGELLFIWKKDVSQNYFELEFLNKSEPSLLPIISDNFGRIVKVKNLTNIDRGQIINSNYFLTAENPEISSNIDFFQQNSFSEITTLPFVQFDIGIEGANYKDIIDGLRQRHSPKLNQDYSNIDISQFGKSTELSQLEYAVTLSASLSKSNIPNRLFYGIAAHPSIDQTVHYWVQIEENGKFKDLDIFYADLLGLKELYDIDFPKVPFGILDENSLDNISIIENLNSAVIRNYNQSTEIFSVDNSGINFSLFNNSGKLNLSATNTSSYFGKFLKISDESLDKNLKSVLIPPGKITNIELSSEQEIQIDISYSLGNEEKQESRISTDTKFIGSSIFKNWIKYFAATIIIFIIFKVTLRFKLKSIIVKIFSRLKNSTKDKF
jgi:hypothetical protein